MTITTPSSPLRTQELGPFGLGLSLYSPWAAVYKRIPSAEEDEASIQTILAAIDQGVRLLDSATFYGHDHHGLKLLAKVIKRVGREKLILSVKFGGKVTEKGMEHHVGRDDVRREIDTTLSILGVDYVDIFVPARVTPETPIEETIDVQEGKIRAIGLSEASAASIARASAVHPIACLQTEYGPMETSIEQNGILDACRQHNVLVLAYGVVQHGFLSSKGLGPWEEFRDAASRAFYPRFHKDNYEHNQGRLLRQLQAFVQERQLDISISALAVAWVIRRGRDGGQAEAGILPLLGMRTTQSLEHNIKAATFASRMTQQDLDALENTLRAFEIRGQRYPPHVMKGVGQ